MNCKCRIAGALILLTIIPCGCSKNYLRLNAVERIREMPELSESVPVYVYYHSRFRGTRAERWAEYNPSIRGQRYIFGEVYQAGKMVTKISEDFFYNKESVEAEDRLLANLFRWKSINWSQYLPDISYMRLDNDSIFKDPRHVTVAQGSVSYSGKPFVELLVREARRLGANVVFIDHQTEDYGKVTAVRYSRDPSSLKDGYKFDLAESNAPSRYNPQYDKYFKVTRTVSDIVGHTTWHRYLRFEELMPPLSGGK